ncbi:nitrilase-related carbon-nitrogen hydrolase [Treponema putidum]|uniref:nitrilase-related carbon-nitrogen hydrolase n=1 Tax=Treponema putidum TaxID=221027 RepID=UPI0023EA6BB3|nr:nitrilase-related carbon-nitrogen hydrolase [Treponema putidum]
MKTVSVISQELFQKKGANIIINLTNDAWAQSTVSQYQHLSMSVFRAVENRLPVLRATSSGQTAFIDQNGNIKKMLPPFAKDILIADVTVLTEGHKTVYSYLGDFFWNILHNCFNCNFVLYHN